MNGFSKIEIESGIEKRFGFILILLCSILRDGGNMASKSVAIVFGGSGFVGRHLIRYLLKENIYNKIIVADLVPPAWDAEQVTYVKIDIRNAINPSVLKDHLIDSRIVIFNLAAISKIPGFLRLDYFRTNTKGAENICSFAVTVDCHAIIFTSTMAVYGASEEEKREDTLPQPDNPYGVSKLVAEYIHRLWLAGGADRKLSIARPGIIYGEDENANFSRLYRAIKKGYFFYPGRKDTRKASIYVKDVVTLLQQFVEADANYLLYNLVYPVPHTIEEICQALASSIGKKAPRLIVPAGLLLAAGTFVSGVARLFNRKNIAIHPDRVRKMMVSTHVLGTQLEKDGYHLTYSLKEGINNWLRSS